MRDDQLAVSSQLCAVFVIPPGRLHSTFKLVRRSPRFALHLSYVILHIHIKWPIHVAGTQILLEIRIIKIMLQESKNLILTAEYLASELLAICSSSRGIYSHTNSNRICISQSVRNLYVLLGAARITTINSYKSRRGTVTRTSSQLLNCFTSFSYIVSADSLLFLLVSSHIAD